MKTNLREEKLRIKEQTNINRNLVRDIKEKHAEILALEEKI